VSTTEKYLLGSPTTLLSTGLNSLASDGLALSAAYDNTQSAAGDGAALCDVELVATFAIAPAGVAGCTLWFLGTQDGVHYEDGDASTAPGRLPDGVFPLRPVTTTQRVIRRLWLPFGVLKALLKNDAGSAMAASGNTLRVRPVWRQGT
jgi:hypothetical protein